MDQLVMMCLIHTGGERAAVRKKPHSGEEGTQAGPHPSGRPNHALGWRAFGSEEVEGARSGQSLLASRRRQARRKEGIARSHPRSPHEACWHLGGKQADGTDGFRVLCHQFFASSWPRLGNCISRCKTCSLTMKHMTSALLCWLRSISVLI